MKLNVKEKTPKTAKKRVPFYISTEQIDAIRELDEWLENRENFDGKLPWAEHLSEKITAEMSARLNVKDRHCKKIKFVLSADLVQQMSRSDSIYKAKGYMPDWNSRVSYFIDYLIRAYSRQLVTILGDAVPDKIDSYLNSTRKNTKAKALGDFSTRKELTEGVVDEQL